MLKILLGLFCVCIVGLEAEFVIPECLGVFFCTEIPDLERHLTFKNGTSGRSVHINKDIVTDICSFLLSIATCIDSGVPPSCAAYTKLYSTFQNVVTAACHKNIQDIMDLVEGFNDLGPEQEDFINCMGKHLSEKTVDVDKCSILQSIKTCNYDHFSSRSPDAVSNIESYIDQYNDDICYLRSFLD
ncbi:uncharacterized protein LOC127725359 isoform X1 [Mytilus californianus]|uniref:uncharacterized protein LOC127725359 isoform X1 n=1 Tax=Mytilus californianus TaxID=6549 RepID=UPI002247AA6E|nr:uncharacterized protein LOC127725359 isoform X1 [Mytilus californianus]